jgi:hypothetical protein
MRCYRPRPRSILDQVDASVAYGNVFAQGIERVLPS